MRSLLTITSILIFAGAFPACSCSHNGAASDDMSVGSVDDGGVVPSTDGGCGTAGTACSANSACCSGVCDPTMNICTVPQCKASGDTCTVATECCSLNCSNGTCSGTACVSDGQACTAGGAACCSTNCVNGTCAPLNGSCKTAGNSCTMDLDCCSGLCNPGTMTCAAPSQISYCTQPGDICFHDNECCTGVCTIASGSTAGTCATLTTSCKVDGLVCNGCSTSPRCCSSFCAPFGTSGSTICQPASGCHVLGDLCLTNADCCGGDAMNGLPGSGLVICVPDPNHPQIGTCSMANPNNCTGEPTCKNTCQPEGDVCHYLGNGACSSNSFPNDCCSAPGNKGLCQLDKLGVPRCFGIGTMCQMPGQACASSADCCNGLPCVPDSTGHLVCGSTTCVPTSGVCTTNADCCTGNVCVVPPGSTSGSCTAPPPPPGADMAGSTDMATTDMAMQACSLIGQTCSTSVPCCANNGNCTNPTTGTACAAGDTNCYCQQVIIP